MPRWKHFTAPFLVARPKDNKKKGVCRIKSDKNPEFEWICMKIIMATIDGRLGYYSGLHPEGDRIFVHFANPKKEENVKKVLLKLGVNENLMTFYPKDLENICWSSDWGVFDIENQNQKETCALFWGKRLSSCKPLAKSFAGLIEQEETYPKEELVERGQLLIYVEKAKRKAAFNAVEKYIKVLINLSHFTK